MSNNRDTQFLGFAKAEMDKLDIGPENDYTQLILARAAYDLVEHTTGHTLEYLHECGISTSGGMGKRIAPSIPDMAELPEETNG